MNLNKLFPRLTISAKLAIAFVLLAVIPLTIVAVVGTRSALMELERSAETGLEHDMELASVRTARSLREIGQHVDYVADVVGLDLIGVTSSSPRALEIVEAYLVSDPSALFRFKAIDEAGLLTAVVGWRGPTGGADIGTPQALYQWAVGTVGEAEHTILPIEVRAEEDPASVIPAVAVLAPILRDGEYVGAVIGEAAAESVFGDLELASPALSGGITALTDEEGRFLFHSEHKRDWGSLLAGSGSLDLRTDLPAEVASRVLAGGNGSTRLEDGRLISYRRLAIGGRPTRSLTMYRILPATVVDARIRRFLMAFGALGALLGLIVLAVSTIASRQITRPVYALRNAARELTHGGRPGPLIVETNDELEDLAGDFNQMAETLSAHRADLESLIEERTTQLLKAEAHLGRIVTDAEDAILALSPEGDVTLWNSGAEALFGYDSDEAVGRRVTEVLGTAENNEAGSGGPEILDVENLRTKRRHKDGTWIPVTVTKSEITDEQGEVVGHSLIVRDERARARLEEQMRRSERLAAISIMAGGIAHELNNPLSILGNRIELMQRDAVRRDAGVAMLEDLEVLRKHVGRIGSVTSDLIKFARDDADELAAVDVNSVVDRVARLLNKVFVESDLSLEIETSETLPLVLGNESAVETLLVNLLLNAQQATPPGGEVTVVTRTGEQEKTVRIEVTDSGPGVPDDLRRRVFEPFFTTKAERGGTGLGLAVCRALVDRVGGTLELGNCNGRGASFVVALPRKVEIQA
jgi:PAS domain S-box-containing protein